MQAVTSPAPPLFDAPRALERHFGLPAFRPGQAEVIESVLSGRNTMVVMPTGAGKSLCYQLPAMLLDGVTLVVSPLIALMKDQVTKLNERGIAATFINSTLSDIERQQRQEQLRTGQFKLVYVAPERFRSESFLEAVKAANISLFAIDEAHCISQWGHDFRPDYARLGEARKRLRPPRTVALTATATPEVRDDITRVLLMKDPQVFAAGFDRPNLFLEVLSVSGDDDKRRACVKLAKEEGSGLVYCATRRQAEALYQAIKGEGVPTVLYHAGLDDRDRAKAQEKFMGKGNCVAVATNAFGMGIDKPDIRFIAHAGIPRAVEAYYQEIGRAGRDGRPAHVVLLFNHADVFTQERMIEANHPPPSVFADVWEVLQSRPDFDKGISALATAVGAHEQEVSAVLKHLERVGHLTRGARGEGELVFEFSQTKPLLSDDDTAAIWGVLTKRGARSNQVELSLDALALKAEVPLASVRRVLRQLETTGALKTRRPFAGRVIHCNTRSSFEALGLDLTRLRANEKQAKLLLKRITDYAYAKTCRRQFILRYFGEKRAGACQGCDVCVGPRLVLPAPLTARRGEMPSSKEPYVPPPHSARAASSLRQFRRDLSRALDMPAYILFNDASLYELAAKLPTNRFSFLKVKGMSEQKWERVGPKVIELCSLARAAGDMPMLAPDPPRRPPSRR
ncbi:MAG: ATP-dependent DNA helicase [Myxococcaceae bacterium]|nr:ATP-dependent DNA helicase [Myxococcaceae bacterium]